jgi:hypothetical protein
MNLRGAPLRWAALFTVLLGIVLAIPTTAFPADGEPSPQQGEVMAAVPLPDEDAISLALLNALDARQERLAEREERLGSPAAEAKREDSQLAYTDLGPGQTEGLLRSTFGEVLEQLDQDPARYLSDAQVERVVEENAATITVGGDTQLFETDIPIEAEGAAGEREPVDLDLVREDGGWAPENPVVDLTIGATASDGVELGESGVTIAQAGSETSSGQVMGDENVFFGEVGTDTDLMVSPVSHGAELFDLLRSVESPEELRFGLQLPAGSDLRLSEAGNAEVVDSNGNTSLMIPKPWARDAQGTQVPVDMRVDGDSLVLGIDHRSEDLAYPILVDPAIYQDWDSWYLGQGLGGLAGWRWQQNDSPTWLFHPTPAPTSPCPARAT